MSRFGVANHLIDVCDCILCCFCETRVAFVEDFVPNANDLVYGGYIRRMFHYVELLKPEGYEEQRDGNTLYNIYCCQCRMRLGWRLVRTTQRSDYFVVGRFFMKLELLIYQSGETLHDAVFGLANEQAPNDQEGGANDQDRGVNEQVPSEQDLGTNDQDAQQNGGANADQDGGANEQNADQDGDANEKNHDQDGGRPMKRRRCKSTADGGANEQNADQDRDANEQNHIKMEAGQ